MRLVALLLLCEFPLAAFAWLALHRDATGADLGVMWLIGLGAAVVALCVAASQYERRLES